MQRHRQGWALACAVAAAALIVALGGCGREETKAAPLIESPAQRAADVPGASDLPTIPPPDGTAEGPAAPEKPNVSEDTPAAPPTPDTPQQPEKPDEPNPPQRHDRRPDRSDEPLMETRATEMA